MAAIVQVQVSTGIDVLVQTNAGAGSSPSHVGHVHELDGVELRQLRPLPDEAGEPLEQLPIGSRRVIDRREERSSREQLSSFGHGGASIGRRMGTGLPKKAWEANASTGHGSTPARTDPAMATL
ncbi:MAG: hypothetical protein R2713_14770 [Ilumatobacteraceae bacterium]